MKKKIVIIEDEEGIVFSIRYSLVKEGFLIKSAPDGRSGLKMIKEESPHLVILDLILPDLDGLEVLRETKKNPATAHIPVIILTGKTGEPNIILGLELGADDYMTKPFSSRELLARVKAVLRRANQNKDIRAMLFYKGISVNTLSHTVKERDREVALTPKEFQLLVHLIRNKGNLLTRDGILDSVWGLSEDITTRTVDTHIFSLRKKIPTLSESIVTIKQFGYKLKEE